jgi:transcription initiation factor IIE alpha subunit
MSKFPDTGPGPDGERTPEQWYNAIREDTVIICHNMLDVLRNQDEAPVEELAHKVKYAEKEVRRLLSDLRRAARVVGVTDEMIDQAGPV